MKKYIAISDVSRDLQKIVEKLTEKDQSNEFVFTALVTKLEMFEYLADSLVCSQETNLKVYAEEVEQKMKKGQA